MTRPTPRIYSLAFVLLLLLNLGLGFSVYSKEAKQAGSDRVLENIDLMMEVLQLIRKNYVDAEQVDVNQLLMGAISGMAQRLDPYSDFLPPRQMQSLKEESEGEFGGIGISVSMSDGLLTVISTVDGTPAHEAGVLSGDRIVAVDGRRLESISLDEAVALLRGKPGSMVSLTLYREKEEEELKLELKRALIPLESVLGVSVIPDSKIGYLRITQFMEPTAAAVEKALRGFESEKVCGLIMDLRGNPGGLLHSAVAVSSLFLPKNQMIVSVEGRNQSSNYEERTTAGYKFPAKCPIVILVNRGSASAAEVTAGCLRDLNRAVLLGEKTFGKGSVQTVHELPGGYALKLTVAKYYTPSRRVIHGNGLEPDIKVEMPAAEFYRLGQVEPAKRFDKDAQIKRAVELLQSYEVYEQIQKGKVKLRGELDTKTH
ncbi:MAG: S41 family peptidase [Lentisphaeria bacterium]|nr:S41 family peptidase [Lentisphaeria bacterium]